MQMQRRKRGEAPAIGTAAHYEYMRKNLNKQRRAIYRNEALGFKKKSELLQDIRRKEVALATSFNRSYLKTMGLSGEKTRYPFQFILDKGE
jgi:5-bromo-4-chloroindolyl phosphate hydrolysis protein